MTCSLQQALLIRKLNQLSLLVICMSVQQHTHKLIHKVPKGGILSAAILVSAVVELEMDDLTSEQQMSTSSVVASALSGQASSSVKLQQRDVESQQDDSTVIGEMRQRHSEHPL